MTMNGSCLRNSDEGEQIAGKMCFDIGGSHKNMSGGRRLLFITFCVLLAVVGVWVLRNAYIPVRLVVERHIELEEDSPVRSFAFVEMRRQFWCGPFPKEKRISLPLDQVSTWEQENPSIRKVYRAVPVNFPAGGARVP